MKAFFRIIISVVLILTLGFSNAVFATSISLNDSLDDEGFSIKKQIEYIEKEIEKVQNSDSNGSAEILTKLKRIQSTLEKINNLSDENFKLYLKNMKKYQDITKNSNIQSSRQETSHYILSDSELAQYYLSKAEECLEKSEMYLRKADQAISDFKEYSKKAKKYHEDFEKYEKQFNNYSDKAKQYAESAGLTGIGTITIKNSFKITNLILQLQKMQTGASAVVIYQTTKAISYFRQAQDAAENAQEAAAMADKYSELAGEEADKVSNYEEKAIDYLERSNYYLELYKQYS